MNRRKFFKWMGAGTVAVVVAPTARLSEGPVVEQSRMECGCIYGQCTCEVLGYNDYVNFSSFALAASMDKAVANVGRQLAQDQARGIKELYNAVHDQV